MATIKDVARESGLAIGTVSRVMNNRGYISEKTRKKVFSVMERLNYQPSEVARSLIKQKTDTIGVIVPHILHPYFYTMIDCIEEFVTSYGYKLLLLNSRGSLEAEKRYLELCKSNRASGILIFSKEIDIREIQNLGIPVIAIERNYDDGTPSILCDNHKGGVMATKLLLEKGCKEVIMLGGIEKSNMPADLREVGYSEVCRSYGIREHLYKVQEGVYAEMNYRDFLRKILRQHPKADGFFASSDLIAVQLVQVCREMKLSIPKDIKIVGFDDVNIASLVSPMLTTVRQPIREMARLAVDYLVRVFEGEVIPERTILPVSLIERETT